MHQGFHNVDRVRGNISVLGSRMLSLRVLAAFFVAALLFALGLMFSSPVAQAQDLKDAQGTVGGLSGGGGGNLSGGGGDSVRESNSALKAEPVLSRDQGKPQERGLASEPTLAASEDRSLAPVQRAGSVIDPPQQEAELVSGQVKEPADETSEPIAGVVEAVDSTDKHLEETGGRAAEPVTRTVQPVAEQVSRTAEPMVDPVSADVGPVVDTARRATEPATETLGETVEQAAEPVAQPVRETIDPALEPLREKLETVEETVDPVLDPVNSTAEPLVEPVLRSAKPLVAPVGRVADPVDDLIGESPASAPPDTGLATTELLGGTSSLAIEPRFAEGVQQSRAGILDAALPASGAQSAAFALGGLRAPSSGVAHFAIGARASGSIEALGLARPLARFLFGASSSTFIASPMASGSPSQAPPVLPIPTMPDGSSAGLGSGSASGAGLLLGCLALALALSPFRRMLLRYSPDFLVPTSALKLAIERPG